MNPNPAADYANGLRQVADWVEAHPNIDVPGRTLSVYGVSSRAEAAEILRALAPCQKRSDPGDSKLNALFYIERKFGPITLQFVFYRTEVCIRRVVGMKAIPERLIPATPEQLIPAAQEEIVEWDCEPLLDEHAQRNAGAGK